MSDWPERGEFLTRREAAEIARVTVDTVARWQREGKLGKYGRRQHRLVKTTELRRFLYDAEP